MKASKKPKIKGAQFYKVGDKVETIRAELGAWFPADIIDILPNSKCECLEECQCTYKLLFEWSQYLSPGNDLTLLTGQYKRLSKFENDLSSIKISSNSEDSDELLIVDRKLSEIRQVSYLSINWDDLKVGMKVVINYNIEKPKQWGYWYDYIIDDLQKRNGVYFAKGTLLVGYDGNSQKLSVSIDSDNVADVLEIRPHTTIEEKEKDCYETGVKPEYCKKCKNKPKVRCRTCCCCKCGMKKDFELTVQCDECADWYHIYCIKPTIKVLPDDEDWYCPKCNNNTHRAKLEMKQTLKNQKKERSVVRKNSKKFKPSLRKPSGTSEPSSKEENSSKEILQSTENLDSTDDAEMQEVSKKVPEDSQIWNQIRELFPGYDLIRVTADVIRKKEFDGVISCSAEEYIRNDVINEQLWQEAKQSMVNGKEVFLETVKRIFTCSICCELLKDPITLSCRHNFCIDCFFRSLSVNVYNCALCRVDVIHTQHYVVNENLKKALALLFGKKISKKIDA